jgi:60 kDa SS-A/Ro ribonucleoprotein
MTNYLKNVLAPATQREPMPGQVANSAGGFTFAVDDWARLDRFLILGSEGGSYYASEKKLTKENATVITRLIAADGTRLVKQIVAISDSGRAPKNDPAILALAMCAKTGTEETRAAAYAALPKVCRTGTHLYHFVEFATAMGGWGRGMKRAVGNWFNDRTADDASYQLIKYQSRDGWSARDLLRLSHPTPKNPSQSALYSWVTQGYDGAATNGHDVNLIPGIVQAFEEAKVKDVKRVIELITEYRLPREAIPTEHLTQPKVWEALLPHMGLTAMIRNLGTMTKIGLLAPLAEANKAIIASLGNADAIHKSRVHPMAILTALKTYSSGHGFKGTSTWNPVQQIVDALDSAFYLSFKNVVPTHKTTLLAIDVSGSMDGGEVAGSPGISPRMASAAMALVTANVETNYHMMGFSSEFVELKISPKMRLDAVLKVMGNLPFNRTDCSLPFEWTIKNKAKVESFAVYTDNETYAGNRHPHVALADHRQKNSVAAKSAVVGMLANPFTIADPNDAGMMDFVGFDASAPAIMNDFFRGDAE